MMSRRFSLLACAALALVACEDADAPLAPAWGKQRCGHCSMIVGDERFAAQAIDQQGDRLFFDDVGCLATYLHEHPQARHAWVLSRGSWVDARKASFRAGAKTPMDYGFEAEPGGPVAWNEVSVRANASRSGDGR